MKNVDKFYEKSIIFNRISGLLKMFFDMKLEENLQEKIAIDLGAGVGNDAKFLIDKGFKVTCVDKEEKSKEIIMNRIENKENLKFIISNFEDIKLHKADLVYSCFSLHFCKPDKFDKLMEEITKNIISGGYFVGNFLGKEDEWSNRKTMTFLSKEQVLKYFKNFDIIYFAEKKYIKDSVTEKNKYWHVFEIYAKKK